MRVIKIAGGLFLGLVALLTFNANAQTQNAPVSCNWVQTGSQSGQSIAIITLQCQESGGNVAATRVLTYTAPTWQITNCNISLSSGVLNSGTCQSPNLYRPIDPPVSTCANAGKYLGNSCANSTVNIPVPVACGANCSLRFETVGWTAACPHPGQSPAGSPEVKVFCK